MHSIYFPSLLVVFASLVFSGSVATGQTSKGSTEIGEQWPGKISEWHGFVRYDFEVDDRAAHIVIPKNAAAGNPWVWRARFPNFHAEADLILLERGFHIARINTDGMLGSPRAMEHWNAFYEFAIKHDLAKQCVLEGVSRGGLFVYGFASRWPERVACIYCDTPVCDIRSWPGGKGKGRGHDATWQTCLKEYSLTEESVNQFKGNPIDRLASIASAKIPVLHIVSLNDVIVPPAENTFVLAERFRELGGTIDLIKVERGTDPSGGHHFTHPDPLRVADFIERHASVTPEAKDYFVLRGSLDNCRIKFEKTKKGRVVFMGGSITTMKGWRDMVGEYLQEKFPRTEFDFIDAGISSTGSTPGAFRLIRDVFSNGDVDLLFEEAAVNDLHNMRETTEMVRGMEGILRHARTVNPKLDIVVMHFVDPRHMTDYRSGMTPQVIEQHEHVANHYGVPTIHLAREVTQRIDAGQFDWKHDFRNCHPSPFGHRVYVSSIRRLLNTAWSQPLNPESSVKLHPLPDSLDSFSYDRAKMLPLESASDLSGFNLAPRCDPRENEVGGSVRTGFHDVPMLTGTVPGESFSLRFSGRAVGIFVAAGPDAGIIEFSVDGGTVKKQDLFTKWSKGLHIPWVYVLESELNPGEHKLSLRIAQSKNKNSKGHACRIVNLLVNE